MYSALISLFFLSCDLVSTLLITSFGFFQDGFVVVLTHFSNFFLTLVKCHPDSYNHSHDIL